MTWVNQIISAVEASGKVVWSVLLSCAAVLGVEHFYPDLFMGLPNWVFPAIRIAVIFAFVLAIASILQPTSKCIKTIVTYIWAPMKARSVRKELLCLPITEVSMLSYALVKHDRTIWAKPDLPTIISLQDRGLVQEQWTSVIRGDGTDCFEIPKQVWRIMLSMEEFNVSNPGELVEIFSDSSRFSEAKLIAALPQAHPTVRSYSQYAST